MTTTSTQAPDFGAIKGRQRPSWASGDYHMIASIIVLVAGLDCLRAPVLLADSVADWRSSMQRG